jgi:ligand-binding sensor domain-containing protein
MLVRASTLALAPGVLSATLTLSTPGAAVVPDDLTVERFGGERGFPSETITALFRDRAGFLWVGSREGLSVWDGYSVRIYEHEVGNAESLPDNSVRTIYEDREGRLWIGTNSGGLARLDRASGRFEIFRHDPAKAESLSHDSVYAIAEDGEGALWVGTQGGLNRLDPKTMIFERFLADPADPATIPANYAYALKLDRSGRLWVATVGAGVAWIETSTRHVTRVPFAKALDALESDLNVFAIAEDESGTLWFGTERSLYRFDSATASLRRQAVPELAPGKDIPIVTSMARDGNGLLWMSTWNRGLVVFDPANGSSRGYRHDPRREGSLAADRLACVLADEGGDIWVGTWGSGIDRFGTVGNIFRSVLERQPGSDRGLPYREVTSVLEDKDGHLWLGTWGKGLFRRDAAGEAFSGIDAPPDPPLALNTVLSLAQQPDGTVWAGAMAGLVRIDPRTGKATAMPESPANPRGLGPGYINDVLVDRAGALWVGVGGYGLYRRELDGGFKRFASDDADPSSLSDDFVTSLLEGSDGTLWVGTRSGGLNALDPRTGRCTRFLPSATDVATIGHQHVSSLLESRAGVLWVGTDGGGLAKLERELDGSFRIARLTTDEGLVNQNVLSLVEDTDGTIWIGTRHGLSRYDPGSGRFRNYGLGDGLPSVEFAPGAALRGRQGILIGTSRGLLVITPGTLFGLAPLAPTVITEIRTLSGPMPLGATPWETSEIHVPYGTPLSFGFAVLDFRSPHRFRYRLEGRTSEWTDLGANRVIAFTDLPPRSYTMTVRGRSAHGDWSETSVPLRIRVTPPFWMTWWFRLGGGFLLVGGVTAVFLTRTRSLRNATASWWRSRPSARRRCSRRARASRPCTAPTAGCDRSPAARGREGRGEAPDRGRAPRRDGPAPQRDQDQPQGARPRAGARRGAGRAHRRRDRARGRDDRPRAGDGARPAPRRSSTSWGSSPPSAATPKDSRSAPGSGSRSRRTRAPRCSGPTPPSPPSASFRSRSTTRCATGRPPASPCPCGGTGSGFS